MSQAYLESLTLRLAVGLARVPEPTRQLHAQWLLKAQNADGGFSGREGGSDLYYTGFALRGLGLLGELHGEPAERAAEFLRGWLARETPVIDFISLVYGAALLDSAAGIDVFASAEAGWQQRIDTMLESFRRPDGGYAKTDEGQSSSTYQTFLVALCRQLLELPLVDREKMVEFVRSRRRDDGGFVEIGPMRRSGTNPTAAAVGLLQVLDALDDDTRDITTDFLLDMQTDEGGLRANTRIPLADLLSTFTGTLSLTDLEAADELDVPGARDYALSMQQPEGGFRGGIWDGAADVEYTFYGLGTLALLAP